MKSVWPETPGGPRKRGAKRSVSVGWVILCAVLDRPRVITLSWAALSLALFGVLALLVTQDRSPLEALDTFGRRAEDWADGHHALQQTLRFIEDAFNTIPM